MRSWISTHMFIATGIGALAFVFIMALLVLQRSPAASSQSQTISIINTGIPTVAQQSYNTVPVRTDSTQSNSSTLQGGVDVSIRATGLSGDQQRTQANLLTSANNGTDTDLRSLLSKLTRSADTTYTSTGTQPFGSNVYSFIPSSLVSADGVPDTQSLTPTQQALRRYGNEVGSYIQTYEQLHRNDYIAIQDYFRDPQNPSKRVAVKNLSQAMRGVGLSMQHMSTVPENVAALHTALAQSYLDAGDALAAQVGIQGNDAILTSIKTYNTTVRAYVKRYSALALFFSINNITFQKNEPGSEFMFTP